jgi:hypothetical protein
VRGGRWCHGWHVRRRHGDRGARRGESLLLVRSLERRGDELRLRYVGPRRRTIPLARVAGVTGELGIWLTRIELRDGYPVVLAGRPPGVPDLVT